MRSRYVAVPWIAPFDWVVAIALSASIIVPSKYTIEFGAGGRLTARIDCNRGRGTWKSSGASMADGGIYEFEPVEKTKDQARSEHDAR